MKRTAGTLVLHSLLPIGMKKDNVLFLHFSLSQFTSWDIPTFLLSWTIHIQPWRLFGKYEQSS